MREFRYRDIQLQGERREKSDNVYMDVFLEWYLYSWEDVGRVLGDDLRARDPARSV